MKRTSKRFAIALLGSSVLAVGLVAIPYPGPGWLIVFAGLGILATEFAWAERMLARVKRLYDRWQAWLADQRFLTRIAFWGLTAVVVVITIYLLNGYGILNRLFGLDIEWAESPIFK